LILGVGLLAGGVYGLALYPPWQGLNTLTGLCALALVFGLIGVLGVLIPFFVHESWPKEADLASRETAEVLSALYPAIKAHGEPANSDPRDIVQAARDTTEEHVLLRINAKDYTGRPAVAVLTNRRYLLYRTKRQLFREALKSVNKLLEEKSPLLGVVTQMLESFAETYEVLVTPQRKEYRKTMECRDEQLIAGTTPWKKLYDMSLAEVVNQSRAITVRRAYALSKSLVIEFTPRNFSKILQTPPKLEIEPRSVAVAISRIVDLFRAELQWPEQAVVRMKDILVIKWPD
jgi:hypothetical protein